MPSAIRLPDKIASGDYTDVPVPVGGDVGKALTWNGTAFVYTAFDASGGLAAHVAAADPHTQYLLNTGTRTGASSQAQTFTNGIVGPSWQPAADSTTAIQVKNAAGTAITTVDTTNARWGLGTTPTAQFHILSADTPAASIALRVGNTGGVELITATNDRTFAGAGNWTGTNWAVSSGTFLHTAGSTANAVLANANLTAATIISGRQYIVTYTVTGMTTGTLTPKIGTATATPAAANGTYTGIITAAANNADLIFTPTSPFDGALSAISVTRIQYDFAILNSGFVGIGRTDPQRLLDIRAPSHITSTMIGMYNPDTTNNNGIVVSFRADTTGSGAATYKELGAMRVRFIEHNNATCGSEYSFFNEVANVQVQMLTMSSSGYVGIRQATPTAFLDIPAGTTAAAAARFRVGVAPTTPNDGDVFYEADALTFYAASAATNAIVDTFRVRRASTGTPAAGFGVGLSARLMSDTTANRDAGRMTFAWITATDASRAAKGQLTAYYTTSERSAITWGANSTVALLSFYDITTPIARQVLATGASRTVDDVILILQNLGLVKQS